MNDIEYRILRAQAGKGTLPDCSDPATLEIAAALVDAKLIRGGVIRAFGDDPPGVTLGPLTHAGLEALDAEERAREERKVLARLATRGDRLLMAVLVALIGLLLQRWLAAEGHPCRCDREREEQRGENLEQEAKPAEAPIEVRGKPFVLSDFPGERLGVALLVETNATSDVTAIPVAGAFDETGRVAESGERGERIDGRGGDAVVELTVAP